MSASIVSNPSAMNPVYQPIIFGIQLSDLGSDMVKKSMYYKVIFTTGAGVTIDVFTSDPIVPFSAGQVLDIDVSRDLQGYVATSIPQLTGHGSPVTMEDQNFWGKVKMEVYEIITDLETCESTESLGGTSDEVYVINSAPQNYHTTYLNFPGTPQLLDSRPSVYVIDRNAYDFIWVWGSTSVTFTPDIGAPATVSTGAECTIVSMSAYGAYREVMKYMDVTFDAIEGGKTFRVAFSDPCTEDGHETRSITFLHPFGGRAVLTLDEIDEISISSESEIICRAVPKNMPNSGSDNLTRANAYGNTMVNKKAKESVSFLHSTRINNIEEVEQMKSFLASSGYLILCKSVGTLDAFIQRKFILESGSVVYNKFGESADLTVTGYMADDYISHKSDR